MPHVVIKHFPGKTEEQKQELTKAITNSIVSILGNSDASVSIGFEEVQPENWKQVYDKEIKPNLDNLYKKPGYPEPK